MAQDQKESEGGYLITFTLANGDSYVDLMLDERREIRSMLTVLKEAGKIGGETENYVCRSLLQNRVISLYKTFEEEKIYSGDVISLEVLNG